MRKSDGSERHEAQEAYIRCETGTQRDTRSIQRLVPDLCCESWTKFSAHTSGGEQDGGYSAEIPDRFHVHSNSGRDNTQPCVTNAQWSCDQLHVRLERRLLGPDEGNPATF